MTARGGQCCSAPSVHDERRCRRDRQECPVADLVAVDAALKGDDAALREAVRGVRPADLGRDLSRRSLKVVRRIVEANDDRRAATILRTATAW